MRTFSEKKTNKQTKKKKTQKKKNKKIARKLNTCIISSYLRLVLRPNYSKMCPCQPSRRAQTWCKGNIKPLHCNWVNAC